MQPDSVQDSSPLFVQGLDQAAEFDDAVKRGDPAALRQLVDEAGDPAAPYGINPNTGRPYTQSPEQRRAFAERMTAARAAAQQSGRRMGRPPGRKAASGPPKAAKQAPRQAATPPEVTYAQAASGLLSLIPIGLAMAARVLRNERLALDSVAVSRGIPDLAQAAGDIAVTDARIAAVLDKVEQVGPWGAFIMAGLPIALQIGANHGFVEPSETMGILTPDQLMATVEKPK